MSNDDDDCSNEDASMTAVDTPSDSGRGEGE